LIGKYEAGSEKFRIFYEKCSKLIEEFENLNLK
jgi:hypothetical protein